MAWMVPIINEGVVKDVGLRWRERERADEFRTSYRARLDTSMRAGVNDALEPVEVEE